MSNVNDPTNCPACKVSLLGDKIPEDIAKFYHGTHWKREIAIECPEMYDGVYYYQCPDCDHQWGGFRALKGT